MSLCQYSKQAISLKVALKKICYGLFFYVTLMTNTMKYLLKLYLVSDLRYIRKYAYVFVYVYMCTQGKVDVIQQYYMKVKESKPDFIKYSITTLNV